MNTETCKYCGGEIIFRYNEYGQVILIHLSGSCGGNSSTSYTNTRKTMIIDFKEERLLAGFVPQNLILHHDYIDQALDFFYLCRDSLDVINISEIAQWAIDAKTEAQKQAVITYLKEGKMASELVNHLRRTVHNSWLKNHQQIKDILDLEELKESIFNKNSNSRSSAQSSATETSNIHPPINTQIPTPEITLKRIYEWWQSIDRDQYIRKYYEDLFYPVKTSELSKKLKLEKTNRNYWLILFFLGLTHRIGRTGYEQHREFINFCRNDKNWWTIFSNPQPKQKPQEWMNVLDQYFNDKNLVQEIKWLYWMEKFPIIYQLSCYLPEYIQVFSNLDKIEKFFQLNQITAVRSSYIFNGTGIDAPPLMLGMGANFIVRELVRLEVIKPTPYILEHCFVPKGNVRRILRRIGCPNLEKWTPETSKNIYQFLSKEFKELGIAREKVTFNNAFDIPFQLLANNPQLSKDVLNAEIPPDSSEVDDYQ